MKPNIKRKLNYVHSKPQHYYNHLLTFFTFTGILLTLSYFRFSITDPVKFLGVFIVMFFLLMSIAVIVEFRYSGEYIPLPKVYDLEKFVKDFLSEAKENPEEALKYASKYNVDTQKNLEKIVYNPSDFVLSNIRKEGDVYKITLNNIRKMTEFFFLKFLGRGATYTLEVKEFSGKYKIVRVK